MTIPRANLAFLWSILTPRDRKPYGYGGRWQRDNPDITTDCSGIVSYVCAALTQGPNGFRWDRYPYSTESWRVVPVGGRGPFGTICVARPQDIPADAAVKIGCFHGGGGPNSHMACTLIDPDRGPINIESGGNGQRIGGPAKGYNDPSFDDWHYLPGPIAAAVTTPPKTDQSQEKPMGWQGNPLWLADTLRAALGDRLVVEPGWADRGTGGQMGDIWGVMIHHTGNSRERVEVIRDGVNQPGGFLPGPLSQCLIKPDGKCHLVAVGPCNHAGIGSYPGLGANNGNQRLIGFECAWPTIQADGSFDRAERWPDAQIITMRDAATAVVKRLGYGADRVIGHKEYAGSAQGKWDPGNIDMGWFRGEVAKDLRGEFDSKPPVVVPPPPAPVPPPALPAPPNPRTDRVLMEEIWDQMRGPGGRGWPQLGGRTLVDALAEAFPQLRKPPKAI